MVAHTFVPSTLEAEFKTSLVYRMNSRTAPGYKVRHGFDFETFLDSEALLTTSVERDSSGLE